MGSHLVHYNFISATLVVGSIIYWSLGLVSCVVIHLIFDLPVWNIFLQSFCLLLLPPGRFTFSNFWAYRSHRIHIKRWASSFTRHGWLVFNLSLAFPFILLFGKVLLYPLFCFDRIVLKCLRLSNDDVLLTLTTTFVARYLTVCFACKLNSVVWSSGVWSSSWCDVSCIVFNVLHCYANHNYEALLLLDKPEAVLIWCINNASKISHLSTTTVWGYNLIKNESGLLLLRLIAVGCCQLVHQFCNTGHQKNVCRRSLIQYNIRFRVCLLPWWNIYCIFLHFIQV